ncbi:dihydrofolate reductase [Flavobacterium sp. P4023]|uniref:Dihydrofolate reductase n=1 Tax=Flavobacterium flabelliforme TaxID=2816119 RepID=A0ABS5CW81_9FLAO|nr:dihydrofolate reductase [Flavobacterium flabelliforme]MBP4142860.1 dihydrofolate reductase [Flavobacterium flabelliforme]
MITMIAAAGENNALGKDGKIVWHLPNDYKRFRRLTTGHHIIMGRKTYESLQKPLPNRKHIIITRQKDYKAEDCIVVDTIEKALEACPKEEDSFIIGGGEIYTIGISYADKIELTRVHGSFEADAYFPEIDKTEWKLEKSEFNKKDDFHKYEYTYETYLRE